MSMDVISMPQRRASGFVSSTQGGLVVGRGRQMDPVARFVDELHFAAKRYREKYDRYWDSYYEYYRGRQWPARRLGSGNDWRATLTINYILNIIESICAVLLETPPQITVSARHPDQAQYAQTLQYAIDSVWKRRRMSDRSGDALKNGLIYGTGYLKCWWNQELEQGQGDIDIGVVPTEYLYVDPEATDFDDAHYVLEVKPCPLSVIRRQFPEKGMLVHADAPYQGSFRQQKADGFQYHGYETPFRFSSPVSGDNPLVADQTEFSAPAYRPAAGGENWATLIECWVRDYSMETKQRMVVKGFDPTTGQPQVEMEEYEIPMYPYGRLIHCANGIVLSDEPSPYHKWPYVRIVDYRIPSEFYGVGEPETLKDLQHELNKRRSQMIDHATLMGNAVWVVDRESNVDPEMLTNKPGIVIEKRNGTEVRREKPPDMPAWQMQMVELAIRDMREISGVTTISSGMPPKGVRSGSGFEAAQNIGNTRVKTRGRSIETALEQACEIVVSHMQQFYTTPRMVRIIGSQGEVNFQPFDGHTIRGDWDLCIEAGSTMPTTKVAQVQQNIELFKMQAIDRRALLDAIQYPNRDEVLRRMGEQPGPFIPKYPGYPGMPNKDRTDQSGYALSVRQLPQAPTPPTPGGGGQPGGAPQSGPGGPGQQGGSVQTPGMG